MAQQPLFSPQPGDPHRKDTPVSLRREPVTWMQRIEFLVGLVVRVYLGLLVAVLPWLPIWTQSNVWSYWPVLDALGASGFVRGLVSGLGLLNLGIAVVAARYARELR